MSIDSRHIVEQRSRAERTANAEVIPVPDPARDAAYTGTESEESDAAGLPLVPLPAVRRTPLRHLPDRTARPPTDGAPAHPRADSAHPDPSDRAAGRPPAADAGVRERQRNRDEAGVRRGRIPTPSTAPDHTAVRLRGAARRCRRHQAHDDCERHDHPAVRRPAHLDRPGHEGPGDWCVDRTDQLSRRQYGAATAGLGRGAAHRRSVPPGEPEGDRHVQRRHRQPTHAHLQLRAGCVPRGGLRVRHRQRRDSSHLAQPGHPPGPRADGSDLDADPGERVRPVGDPGDEDRRGLGDPDPTRHLVRPGDARRDAGALVALGRCAAVGDLGPVRASARPGHRARRHHVRRHRRGPASGDVDLQRLVHRPTTGRRGEPGRVGGADEVLDRNARDRPLVQPRALVAEVAGYGVGPAGQRAVGTQLHELPVQLPRRPGHLLRRVRLRLQPGRAAVPPACAGALRADGRGAVVQQPRVRAGGLRPAPCCRDRTPGARGAGAPGDDASSSSSRSSQSCG